MGDENSRKLQAASAPQVEHQIFKSLADNSMELFGISDLNLKPIYVNSAGLKRVGLDSFEQAAEMLISFIQTAFFS